MKRIATLLSALLLASCVLPTTRPKTPPAPATRHVNVHLVDATTNAPLDATVTANGVALGVHWQGEFEAVADCPVPLVLTATAPGYQSFTRTYTAADVACEYFSTTIALTPAAAPKPRQPSYTVPTGTPHFTNRNWSDDRGPYLLAGATMFPTEWLYLHDLPRLKANLEVLGAHRFVPRILLVVSSSGQWAHRYVDPRSPEWATAFVETVKLSYSTYGLRPHVTVFGDPCCSGAERGAILAHVLALIRDNGLAPMISILETSNEHQLTDQAELESYARQLETVHPIVSLSSGDDWPLGWNAPEVLYSGKVATAFQFHPDRDVSGDGGIWRPSRQPYGYRDYDVPPGGNGEARGRASSGTSIDALPEDVGANVIAADALMTWLSGWGEYIVHDGTGVYMEETQDGNGHRYANFADSSYTLKIFDTVAKLRDWLPANLPSWNGLTHANPSRNGSFAFATLPNQSFDQQYQQCGMRAYSAFFGAHGITVTLGQCGTFDLIGRSDTTTDVTVRALTGETLDSFTLTPNQHHALARYAGAVALETWFR
jgi:hypothetical protein